MDKVFNNEFRMGNKIKAVMLLLALVFVIAVVTVYGSISKRTRQIVTDQAISSITNISQLNRDTISRSIDNRALLLQVLVERITDKGVTDIEPMLAGLRGFSEPYDFFEMGIVDENFVFHSVNGISYDVSTYSQTYDAWDTEFHISESFLPVTSDEYMVNMFSYPIIIDNELKYVLVANYKSLNFTNRMNTSYLYEKDYNFLITRSGKMAIYPKHYSDSDYNDLMHYVNNNPDIIPDDSGNTFFDYNHEKYYAHFEKLGVNDWYLMSFAKEKDVFADAHTLTMLSLIGNGILWLIIILAVYMVGYSSYRARKSTVESVFYDDLLGIGNGNAVPIYFEQMEPPHGQKIYLTMFDINKFKEFNYIYGEKNGDELLKYIVKVFEEELPETRLFRFVSDHFITLAYHRDDYDFLDALQKVLDRFSSDIDSGEIQAFDISIGIRVAKEGESFRRVMSDALIAKGTVKGIHLKHYAFYNDEFKYRRLNYMAMESGFNQALRHGEFHVYYQPKYDMRDGSVIGAEALVRWINSEGKMISPVEFIPCFEASRQVILLDQYMLEQVCEQMKDMEKDGLPVKPVSVNLSRVHMRHRDLLPRISEIIKNSGVDPHMLVFEITESALYEDAIPLRNIVDYLHSLGCRVDMDDYGVGVSGLRALADNRFDTVKLDKSFIDGIGDERMEAVIQSTITLSQTLGMEIIAEGVEELHQAEHLVGWGCFAAQGFYYSPPVPEIAYRKLLAAAKN